MTYKITASLLALTLLTSTAFVAAPASAQEGRKFVPQNARNSVGKDQAPIAIRKSANQNYRAGLRAGLDRSGVRANAAYARGYGGAADRQFYGARHDRYPYANQGGYAQRVYTGSPYVGPASL